MKEQSEYKGGGYDGESLVQKRKKRSHPLALLAVRWTKWSGLLFPFAAGLPYFDSGSRGKCLSLDNHIFPLPGTRVRWLWSVPPRRDLERRSRLVENTRFPYPGVLTAPQDLGTRVRAPRNAPGRNPVWTSRIEPPIASYWLVGSPKSKIRVARTVGGGSRRREAFTRSSRPRLQPV